MTHTDDRTKVAELIKKARVALVTTVGREGRLVSRPLAVLDRPFDGELYFFTADPSEKSTQVALHDQVNVALEAGGAYLSLSGTASITRDAALIDELWNPHAEAWFDHGRDDPAVALLHVHAESAEFWADDNPRAITLIKYAKGLITGERPKLEPSHEVNL